MESNRWRADLVEAHEAMGLVKEEAPTETGKLGMKLARNQQAAPMPSSRRKTAQYKGVRRRSWSKWATEIRDLVKIVCIWLGTFSSSRAACSRGAPWHRGGGACDLAERRARARARGREESLASGLREGRRNRRRVG